MDSFGNLTEFMKHEVGWEIFIYGEQVRILQKFGSLNFSQFSSEWEY